MILQEKSFHTLESGTSDWLFVSCFVLIFSLCHMIFFFPSPESKRYKAAIIRIDSPGGDALASDL